MNELAIGSSAIEVNFAMLSSTHDIRRSAYHLARPLTVSECFLRRDTLQCAHQVAVCKTGSCLGIVRRQIYRRMGSGEASNRFQRCSGNVVVSTDTVHPASEHQVLIVRGIASKKVRCITLLDQDGDMIRSVTGRGNRDNVPGISQSPAASEWPKRFRSKFKRRRVEP